MHAGDAQAGLNALWSTFAGVWQVSAIRRRMELRMTEPLISYLGKPASTLLGAMPLSRWPFERSVDEDLPELLINYVCEQHGISLTCDEDEKIRTIFLTSDDFDQALFDIPFSSSRRKVLGLLGMSSKSGVAHTHPILGEYGAWDRFDGARHSIHVEYQSHVDRIRMITLMRADVVP
jgi:hypothetical protein